ncbi:hypothetical protein, unlikely [Trypanosoma congolense IL3000]|uniref:Variant surface glycoprotein n=1 Tax=Trypanosoma congolense (strain IL3000) TaxID=1068625 RepID=F9WIB8_TRYCI|nr:hypothetical protein, unlikely [Trypanosoma congolense IL3000]
MKEMLKTVKVTMVVGVLVIGIQADVAKELESTSSFDLLCNVMQATTGVYSAFGNSQLDVVEEKVNELGLIINKVFFGSNWSGSGGGIWSLPETFTAKTPRRSAVCGSNSDSERMPSASDSMASAFQCLCALTTKSVKDMCESHYVGNEK